MNLPPVHICPECRSKNVMVLDSNRTGVSIRRRRMCKKCKARWTGHELTEEQLRLCYGERELTLHPISEAVQKVREAFENLERVLSEAEHVLPAVQEAE